MEDSVVLEDTREKSVSSDLIRGHINTIILRALYDGDKYGYELADTVGREIDISEGSVYPLLKRLRAEGYFEVYLRESPAGPARKYYRLTERGEAFLSELETSWRELNETVEQLRNQGTVNQEKM